MVESGRLDAGLCKMGPKVWYSRDLGKPYCFSIMELYICARAKQVEGSGRAVFERQRVCRHNTAGYLTAGRNWAATLVKTQETKLLPYKVENINL